MNLDEQLQQIILIDGARYTQLELYNEVSLVVNKHIKPVATLSKRSCLWYCCRCMRGTCKTSVFCILLMVCLVLIIFVVSMFSNKA